MSSFAQSLTDSLKAYYDFSGNAQDQSGYGHHGTFYNAVLAADRFGNANSAYYFNGSNAYIEIPTSAQLRPATFPVSFSAWVKFTTTSGIPFPVFVSDYTAAGDYHGFWMNFFAGSNEIAVSYGDNGICDGSSRRSKIGTTNVADNQWHLLVGVIRGPTNMDLYVDCQNDGGYYNGTGGSLAYSSGNIMQIGHSRCSSSDFYYEGYMDEFRFYTRALTQADVNALYNYPTSTSGSNMAANLLGPNQYLCSGQTITLNATASWASSYHWNTGSFAPIISITQPGTYWVDVLGNGCGQYGRDTIVIRPWQDVDIIPDTTICKAQTLVLDATPNFLGYSWSTGAMTQTISVTTAGTYYVNLSLVPGCSLVDTVVVSNGGNAPTANFAYTFQNGNMVQFSNTSYYGTSYQWYFDGVLDTAANPQHYFPCNTLVQVMLISANECGNDTAIQNVVFNCDGIDALNQNIGIKISPIPAENVLHLEYELYEKTNVSIKIYDEVGREMQSTPFEGQMGEVKTEISVANLPNGVYFLHFVTEKGSMMKKLVVFR
jgi:hypothetical protein